MSNISPFRTPERYLDGGSPDVVARLLQSSGDISLVIDNDGIIRDLSFGNDRQLIDSSSDWIGKRWIDVVTIECRGKIKKLLATTQGDAPSPWRQVNHTSKSGNDIPILYRALLRNPDGHLIVSGRDLRHMSELQQQLLDVQHSMEQDFERLHQAESRYRMLFSLASEGFLIIDAESRRIIEANPAAGEVLGKASGKLVGRAFLKGFTDASEDAIEEFFARVRAAGTADDVTVRMEGSDRDLTLGATLLKREEGLYFLTRIGASNANSKIGTDNDSSVLEVIERSPDAFVLTDPDGNILTANSAFADLCQLGSVQQATGQHLETWLGRAGVDIGLMLKSLRERTQIKRFVTQVRPEFAEPVEIELSGVAALDASPPCFGFVIRSIAQAPASRAQVTDAVNQPLAQTLQGMTELIGRVPLKDLVRETSDIIERLCIEAALNMTNDNRASAAGLLGLSRQSLYVKLRRYDMTEFTPEKKN